MVHKTQKGRKFMNTATTITLFFVAAVTVLAIRGICKSKKRGNPVPDAAIIVPDAVGKLRNKEKFTCILQKNMNNFTKNEVIFKCFPSGKHENFLKTDSLNLKINRE